MNEFKSVNGMVQWETDSVGIILIYGKRRMKAGWSEITRAGLVGYSHQRMPDNFPYGLLPGLGRLAEIRDGLAKGYVQLVLARGRSPFKAVRIPLPRENPDARLLAEEVQRNLRERWVGELPLERHTKALGLRYPWWFYCALAVGFIIFSFMILLAAGVFGAVVSGRFDEVPLIAWIALLPMVGVLLWILVTFSKFRKR